MGREPAPTGLDSGRRPRERLAEIQVLRGIAALLVVFHHYAGTAAAHGFAIAGFEHAAVGNVGVDIFFIISGFVLEYASAQAPYRNGDRARFALRRLIRILPLYWFLTLLAFTAVSLLPGAVNSSVSVHQLLLSLVVLPDGAAGHIIPMAWTLSYELAFYILFCLLLSCSPRGRLLTITLAFSPALLVPPDWSADYALLGIVLNPILIEFLAGAWLAHLLIRIKPANRLLSYALLSGAGVILLLEFNYNTTDSLARLLYWGMPALMLVGGMVLHKGAGASLAGRLLRWIGDRSYSLFLSHFFTIAVFTKLLLRSSLAEKLPHWLTGAAMFLACLLIAQLCYRFIEKPSQLFLYSWWRRRFQDPQAAF